MLTRATITCLVCLLAQPATALSCIRPDAVRQYEQARDSEDLYTMVIGSLDAETPIAVPKRDAQGNYPDGTKADTTVRFTGRELTRAGFTAPFDEQITVRTLCLSVWCASPPATDAHVFVTLKHDRQTLLLELSPCPTNALAWNVDDEARVLNCHRFGKCTAQ